MLDSATRDAATPTETVSGQLVGAPNTIYRLDLYWSSACLANGRGGAYLPLLNASPTSGATGTSSFTRTMQFGWGNLPAGGISGIVTDPAGNTSEIGNCVAEKIGRIFKNGFE